MYFQLAPVYFDALSGLVFLVVAAVHVKSFLLVWRGDPGYLGLDYEKKLRDIVSLAESGANLLGSYSEIINWRLFSVIAICI